MGSYSALYFSDVKALPERGEISEDSPYLQARSHLPLLWLALFRPEDIVHVPDPDEPANPWPYLVAHRTKTMATLAARRELLTLRFPAMNPDWFDQFAAVLEQAPSEFVHLDTVEIMVGTGPEWRQTLETLLGMFEDDASRAQAGWRQFNSGYSGPYDGESATRPWTYCGSSADSPMPWEPAE
jgi:hypothetical protein